jgi:hypothetical protein
MRHNFSQKYTEWLNKQGNSGNWGEKSGRYFDTSKDLDETLFTENVTELVTNPDMYSAFAEELLEGYAEESEENSTYDRLVLQPMIESIIEENNADLELFTENVGANGQPAGEPLAWAVARLPIMLDIYNEPILKEILTIRNMNVAPSTIQRLKFRGVIEEYDGSKTEFHVPTLEKALRPKTWEYNLKKWSNVNIFTGVNDSAIVGAGNTNKIIDKEEFTIQRFKLVKVYIKELDISGMQQGATKVVELNLYPDARTTFNHEFTIETPVSVAANTADSTKSIEYMKLMLRGDFNKATGKLDVTLSERGDLPTSSTANSFAIDSIDVSFRIIGIGGDKGVATVEPEMTQVDIVAETDEHFGLKLTPEDLQDWKALVNIDMFGQILQVIKHQFGLNLEYDIAELLGDQEGAMETNGFAQKDYDLYATVLPGAPNYKSILQNIEPLIRNIKMKIWKKTRFNANHIVCGIDVGTLLTSLQQYAIRLKGSEGSFGLDEGISSISDMKIIMSAAIPDNKLYILNKEQDESLTSLLLGVYKPLYFVKEITGGKQKLTIKDRKKMVVVRNDNMGMIEFLKGNATNGYTPIIGEV